MHIVYVCREYVPSLRGGGIASYIKEMAKAFVDAGHKVTVVCASDDTRVSSDTIIDGVRVIRLSGGDFVIPQVEAKRGYRALRPLYRFYSYREKIVEVLKSLPNVDIVEVADYGAENWYFDQVDVPVVLRLHAPGFVLNKITNPEQKFKLKDRLFQSLRDKEKMMVGKARYVTSCSEALKRIINKEFGFDESKITVVRNPIQVDKWEYKDRVFIPINGTIKLLLAGTITPLKGGEDLIAACEILQNQGVKVQLTMVGKESRFAQVLREKYADKNWLDVRGPVARDVLMQMYDNVDIVCAPSWFENMPMVCIEAMLMGSILVASNAGGIPEVIIEGKTGFMVDAHSPEQLVEKILFAANMPVERKAEMAKTARKRIEENFSMVKILHEMTEYYGYVINDYKNKK